MTEMSEKKYKTFFCIIFAKKICVKINENLQKNTTQKKKLWYNNEGNKVSIVLSFKEVTKTSWFLREDVLQEGHAAIVMAVKQG